MEPVFVEKAGISPEGFSFSCMEREEWGTLTTWVMEKGSGSDLNGREPEGSSIPSLLASLYLTPFIVAARSWLLHCTAQFLSLSLTPLIPLSYPCYKSVELWQLKLENSSCSPSPRGEPRRAGLLLKIFTLCSWLLLNTSAEVFCGGWGSSPFQEIAVFSYCYFQTAEGWLLSVLSYLPYLFQMYLLFVS